MQGNRLITSGGSRICERGGADHGERAEREPKRGSGVQGLEDLVQLPIYCQRQNCNPGILVSRKVRFMYIFAGVC